MLGRATFAAAVLAIAGTAFADDACLPDADGVQCDALLEVYRADDVTTSASDFVAKEPFVAESLHGHWQDPGLESPAGEDVLYWDGDTAMVVPEETGPRLEIADW